MNLPILSVVIPCYNQGVYLPEILSCFSDYHRQSTYELIIVNDGSTDEHTIATLKEIEAKGFKVIHQENQGVCITRNNGIKASKGKYILPLDGDDRMSSQFIYEAVEILESKPEYSIVYCNGEYFNTKTGLWIVGEFNLQRLMLWNYIPSCAIYRRSAWDKTDGYDPKVKGLEDWELWLAMAFAGEKFYYLEKVFFQYRVSPNSLSRSTTSSRYAELWNYIQYKHSNYIGKAHISDDFVQRFRNNKRLWIKLFFRVYFPEYFTKLVKKGKVDSINLD
jgi:glycosyltransferase involved in cell wall biosynthesis